MSVRYPRKSPEEVRKKTEYWKNKNNIGILAKLAIGRALNGTKAEKKAVGITLKPSIECETYQSAWVVWEPILRAKLAQCASFRAQLQMHKGLYLLEFSRSAQRIEAKTGDPVKWAGMIVDNKLHGLNWMGCFLMCLSNEPVRVTDQHFIPSISEEDEKGLNHGPSVAKPSIKRKTIGTNQPTYAQTGVRFYQSGTGQGRWDSHYQAFSNLYGSTFTHLKDPQKDVGFTFEGLYYPTVENAFQSYKYRNTDNELAEFLRSCEYGAVVFAVGRSGSQMAIHMSKSSTSEQKETYKRMWSKAKALGLPKNWDDIKVSLMEELVFKKFQSHSELSSLLLGTGQMRIVEASPCDDFWGEGKTGQGQNNLGLVLERVRLRLRLMMGS